MNIKVKLIEPGVIKTDFYERSLDTTDIGEWTAAYGDMMKRGQRRLGGAELRNPSSPTVVARVIYQAATDSSWRMRYQAGADAKLVSFARWLLPERLFRWVIGKVSLD